MPLSRPLLLVVDVQVGLRSPEYGPRSGAPMLENIAALLVGWRQRGFPVVYSAHMSAREGSPLERSSPGRQIEPAVSASTDEEVWDKSTNSVFKVPQFLAQVKAVEPSEIVVVGMATDACITATAREAKDMGFAVAVIEDACATFARGLGSAPVHAAELVHAVALAALAASGINVRSSAVQLAIIASAA
jgi:nicotinamidase-related amidase